MSSARIPTTRDLLLVRLNGEDIVMRRIGKQHYLVFASAIPITEIQCIPAESNRWYWRGSSMRWEKTRKQALACGVNLAKRGATRDGKPLGAWSKEAEHILRWIGIKDFSDRLEDSTTTTTEQTP